MATAPFEPDDTSSSRSENEPLFFLGPLGTYSHQAATALNIHHTQLVPCSSITEVIEQVVARKGSGVVPVRNSTAGAVHETSERVDLHLPSLRCTAHTTLAINHALLALPSARPPFERIYSHRQALAQCHAYLAQLKHHNPDLQVIESASTAGAAESVSRNPKYAAICSSFCAKLYNLSVLVSNVQDEKMTNETAFALLKPALDSRDAQRQTQVSPSLANVHTIEMSAFVWHGISPDDYDIQSLVHAQVPPSPYARHLLRSDNLALSDELQTRLRSNLSQLPAWPSELSVAAFDAQTLASHGNMQTLLLRRYTRIDGQCTIKLHPGRYRLQWFVHLFAVQPATPAASSMTFTTTWPAETHRSEIDGKLRMRPSISNPLGFPTRPLDLLPSYPSLPLDLTLEVTAPSDRLRIQLDQATIEAHWYGQHRGGWVPLQSPRDLEISTEQECTVRIHDHSPGWKGGARLGGVKLIRSDAPAHGQSTGVCC
ncbi:uncharacterized protein L969DRAFT_342567 [Mixia osmundae IAM 14324]|uniref:Prephenate dehydratase domain-containing protein n=1 Tax=Mixia osmundae (strain CBS 9802 / IAM 14324 / JCM 22182 / KY 12970) TaxID=764103 RepID=G7E5Y9_MIXOS|nr:uncharacterized protein L969DRAFT_342567 [Mixia osmundae IAM 14324]KEI40601.1 hypothetical protein L969DRAFT_342567 [Mixia osmundae IAM 14324]GAA98249.1 hypothetical protein E5Q_04932 [Mixia osmundae IAM 14324]